MDLQSASVEKMPEEEIMHEENDAGNEPKPLLNGLALHEEVPKTTEEERAERRFVLKIDFLILPLLIIMFFLAQLVRQSSLEAQNLGYVMTDRVALGPR
jgi:hypothetical protein